MPLWPLSTEYERCVAMLAALYQQAIPFRGSDIVNDEYHIVLRSRRKAGADCYRGLDPERVKAGIADPVMGAN